MLLKSKYSRPTKEPIVLGIEPKKPLDPRRIFVSDFMADIELGTVPTIELVSRYKTSKAVNALMLSGIVDVMRLLYSVSCFKAIRLPIVLGIGPEKELVSSENTSRAVADPMDGGMAPVKEFSYSSRICNAVREPILTGRGPTK